MLEIYLDGALEPIRCDEPIQATMTNMNAAIQNNMFLFMTKDPASNVIVLAIPKITHIREVG